MIRLFEEKDRQSIEQICIETAKGKYATEVKKQKLIALMFVEAFLNSEPENCFVVDEDGIIKGYIVCSCNAEKYKQAMKQVLKKIRKISFIHYLFTNFCIKICNSLKAKYGGEFHLNIATEFQGKNYGPQLLNALRNHLAQKNVKQIFLITANRKTRGYSFYKHYGFSDVEKLVFCSRVLVCKTDLNITQA